MQAAASNCAGRARCVNLKIAKAVGLRIPDSILAALASSRQIIGGKRTELLGYVRAADERKALAEAIKVFEVPADWRTRIIVVQVNIGWFRRRRRDR